MLTIAYITNRLDCRIEWFFDSLWWQWEQTRIPLRLVVVDFFTEEPDRALRVALKAKRFTDLGIELIHTAPMPCVWQGKHRLTTRDYFAAANCRNTAICLAPDGWLAYVDDLSVLIPGWLDRVKAAMDSGYIACGTYEKVKELVVQDGIVTTCTHDPAGGDSRLVVARKQYVNSSPPAVYPCTGSWLFGCSVVAPVEAFLKINGWDTDCDSMGAEDYPCGYMLEKQGYKLCLDPKMITWESWELHFVETPFLRIDKPNIKGQRDGSNAYLKILLSGRDTAPNYFGEEGIAGVRQRVLKGEPFPIIQCPDRDWRDGQLLSEM
jgi:hypothetical protein